MAEIPPLTRILVVGGGFGGVYTTMHLQRVFKRDPNVRITLVDRDNYFLMTPLLFEAGSGVLDPRHCVTAIRRMLKRTQFVEAEVEHIFAVRVKITTLSAARSELVCVVDLNCPCRCV